MNTGVSAPVPAGEHHVNCVCASCGQLIKKLNPHHMDSSKVNVLERIGRMNLTGSTWVKVQQDGRLIKEGEPTIQIDAVHACRLCWFGLLESKERRSGLYRMTELGFRFLTGQATVPTEILCRGGKVITRSADQVSVSQIKEVIYDKAYWDEYPGKQISFASITSQPLQKAQ